MRWGGLIAAAVPATYLTWHVHNQPWVTSSAVATGLRIAAVMLATGLAFTVDDPTEDSTGYAPVSILARRMLRVLLGLPVALVFWLLLRSYAVGHIPADDAPLPAVAMIVEFVTFAAVAYAGAAIGARLVADRLGGLAGAGAVMIVATVLGLFPWSEAVLLRVPGTPPAAAVADWWYAILGTSALVWWRISLPPGMSPLALGRSYRARNSAHAITEPRIVRTARRSRGRE